MIKKSNLEISEAALILNHRLSYRSLLVLFSTLINLIVTVTIFANSAIPDAQTSVQNPVLEITKLHFTTINIEDGLADNEIWTMFQDNLGFVWIGTSHGLSRYDGLEAKNYNHSLNEKHSISHNNVQAIFQDQEGLMWVGTFDGLNRLNKHQKQFTKFFHDLKDNQSLSDNNVRAIIGDDKANIWIGTTNGINLWKPSNPNAFQRYLFDNGDVDKTIKINALLIVGSTVIAGSDKGLYIYSHATDDFVQSNNLFPKISVEHNVIALFVDSQTTIWVAIDNAGVFYKKQGQDKFSKLKQLDETEFESLISPSITSINQDLTGNIWLGTQSSGLLVYYPTENKITSVRRKIHSQTVGFNSDKILSILRDDSGLMWVGTELNGIFNWSPRTLYMEHFDKSNFSADDKLFNASVWHFAEDNDKNLWIATKNGVQYFNSKTHEIKPISIKASHETVEPEVFYIAIENDHIWFAGNKILIKYVIGKGVTQRITSDPEQDFALPGEAYVYAVEIIDGVLYIVINGEGFYALDTEAKTVTQIKLKGEGPDSLSSTDPISLVKASDNSLWVLTKDGLFNYFPEEKRIRFAINGGKDKLSANRVSALFEESINSFWLGTSGNGINHLIIDDYETGLYHIEQFNHIEALKYQLVNGITLDDAESPNVWISSHAGLFEFNPRTNAVRQFSLDDGIQAREFNEGAYFKDTGGYLYFGGVNGFNRIDPNKFSVNIYEPPLRITNFSIQCSDSTQYCYEDIRADFFNSVCTSEPCADKASEGLVFPHTLEQFEISFVSLDYTNPAANNYRYRLNNQDMTPWIELGNEHSLVFTKLESDNYSLELQGSNHAGLWSQQTIKINFTIEAPWYKQSYISVMVLFSIFFILTIMRIKQREKETIERVIQKTEENFQFALWGSGDELWEWDIDSDKLTRTNPIKLIDFASGKSTEKMCDVLALIHPMDRDKVNTALKKHLRGDDAHFEFFFRIKSKAGGYLWTLARARVVDKDESNRPKRLMGSIKDITLLKATEDKLTLIAKAFENTMDGISILDPSFKAVLNNRAFYKITGLSVAESINKQYFFSEFSNNHDKFQQIKITLMNFGEWAGEIWETRNDGSTFAIELKIDTVREMNGQISHFICIFSDITYRKKTEDDLRKLANIDSLTGLPNRSLFMSRLSHAIAYAKRKNTKFALLFIDLDHFKNVNDTLGHSIGDEMLRKVAKRLKRCVRDVDTVARLGGDEFTIILEDIKNADVAGVCASKIIRRMKKPIDVGVNKLKSSPSIGIGIYPSDGTDVESLLKNADLAMYSAKEKGRNNYQFFNADLTISAMERIDIENKLRKAIDKGELVLHYQPKVISDTGKLTGFEALIRWNHPEEGMISPINFIPIAEETGLIIPMGDWILEEAIKQGKHWLGINPDCCSIAINLSARQFQQENLSESIQHLLEKYDLPSKYIELEITEGTLMSDMDHTIKTLNTLRNMGLSLSLDDFGTGYSSLTYLKRFPVNKIKVDQSFIRDITTDAGDASIVASIISLAHNLGLSVIAEGCETKEQLDFICSYNCEEVQGYLFSRPLPANEAEVFLRAGEILIN